jgi:hypothetical protein
VNPTPPGPDPDDPIGEAMDRYLAALERAGGDPPAVPPDTESAALRPVVDQLYRLGRFLDGPTGPGTETTVSYAGRESEHGPVGPSARGRVGKYQVVRELGRGGQGSALLALDPDLKRHVVLKVYHGAGDPGRRQTILAEGRALARVRSPYVAQVYAAELDAGVPLLVVEYVPGRTLSEAAGVRPFAPAAAAGLVARLAEGLAAVHACGLLHRDLKPSNVVVGDDGLPRLLDFGLAAPMASADLEGIAGTVPYMAPEQARGEGERVDARTDLYGLGAVLYELLTGRPPHQGATRPAILAAARAGDVVPVGDLNPGAPPALARVCMRCLEKDPAARFGSATELAAALRVAVPRAGRPWHWAALAAAAVLVVAGLIAWRVSGPAVDARVDPGPPVPGEVAGDDLDVTVAVDGAPPAGVLTLTEGEFIVLRLGVTRDAYVGLWYEDETGRAIRLFPNRFEPDNLVPAGRTTLIPGNPRYRIRVTPARGKEALRVLATAAPWSPPDAGLRGVGPEDAYSAYDTPESARQLDDFRRELLRGLELVPHGGGPAKSRDAVEKVFELRVRPKPGPSTPK